MTAVGQLPRRHPAARQRAWLLGLLLGATPGLAIELPAGVLPPLALWPVQPARHLPEVDNWRLQGILSSPAGPGVALLSQPGQAAFALTRGESLADGLVLYAVYPDHVLLERNGALGRLNLDLGPALSGSAATSPTFAVEAPAPLAGVPACAQLIAAGVPTEEARSLGCRPAQP